jgi:hypothetical protein
MKHRIPNPSGPGDWRYDPTTGQLTDASKAVTPVAQAPLAKANPAPVPSPESSPAEPAGEPVGQAAEDEYVDMVERTAEPGEALPPIKTTKRGKRTR